MSTEKKEPDEARIIEWEEAVRRYAEQHGGTIPLSLALKPFQDRRQARLQETAASPRTPAAGDTEVLLNNLIEECRFLMHEVAFHSARLTMDADDRIRFLMSAQGMAETGAKVADAITRLRGGGPVSEERRQRMIIEHVQRVEPRSPTEGEGGPA